MKTNRKKLRNKSFKYNYNNNKTENIRACVWSWALCKRREFFLQNYILTSCVPQKLSFRTLDCSNITRLYTSVAQSTSCWSQVPWEKPVSATSARHSWAARFVLSISKDFFLRKHLIVHTFPPASKKYLNLFSWEIVAPKYFVSLQEVL